MFERILVLAVGELPPQWLLNKVQQLATSATQVRIELFAEPHLLQQQFYQPEPLRAPLQQQLITQLEQAVAALQHDYPSLSLSVEINAEPPSADRINQTAAQFGAELLVKACRQHHRLDQHLLGHIDWQLIRLASIPVLLLRPSVWCDSPRLIVAVDPLRAHKQPKGLDTQVLSVAQRLRDALDGQLELLHTYQPLPAAVILDDALMLDYNKLQRRMAGEHRVAMDQFAERSGLTAQTPVHILCGEPAREIARFANEQAVDLAALGVVDRSGIEDLLMGTTAEALLDELHTDLLITSSHLADS